MRSSNLQWIGCFTSRSLFCPIICVTKCKCPPNCFSFNLLSLTSSIPIHLSLNIFPTNNIIQPINQGQPLSCCTFPCPSGQPLSCCTFPSQGATTTMLYFPTSRSRYSHAILFPPPMAATMMLHFSLPQGQPLSCCTFPSPRCSQLSCCTSPSPGGSQYHVVPFWDGLN